MNKKSILVADDNPTVLKLLKSLLEKAGFRVIEAVDGLQAVELSFTENPDLIMLDIMMPRMNGFQACRLIKNELRIKDIPVVMLTAKDQPTDRYWGLETGADSYLTKTVSFETILKEIKKLLRRKKPSTLVRPKTDIARPVESIDILSSLNDLLDRKLYEANITKEISNLAYTIFDIAETANEGLTLLRACIHYRLASVTISDENRGYIFIKPAVSVSDEIVDEFTSAIFRKTREINHVALGPENATVKIFKPLQETAEENEEPPPKPAGENVYWSQVKLRKNLFELVALYDVPVIPRGSEEEKSLSSILNQLLIVTENAFLYRELQELAIRDGLTGLYNRRYFMENLGSELIRSKRYRSNPSLLLADIDHFKDINDRHGHVAGDMVLRHVGEVLNGMMRKSDVVARYGGEEFLILLPETSLSDACDFAERLRLTIEQTEFVVAPGCQVKITISIGVSQFPGEAVLDPKGLLELADKALYQAKSDGRNIVRSLPEGHG
ncbi:MAG: hypothetical protein BA872_05840 [Desulfobacterales bacterium C00003060]|nr:MAG: hypothetical protein BA872_05840 [Desulfobacterales bacterium C00003060]OEU84340.1 MAG: hypothetical protein BA865_10900 [Desulfobacterales bacterium S5133MH4]